MSSPMRRLDSGGTEAGVLTNRVLGTLGVAGGVAYTFAGLRLLTLRIAEDPITDLLGLVWAVCWIFAGIGLLRARITGASLPGRVVSITLILGFCLATLWGIYRLIDPIAADRSPVAVAPMVVILGMLGTGILVLRAGRWSGWHRWLPLLTGIIYVGSVAVSVRTGQPTLGYAFSFAGVCFIGMGLWLRSAAPSVAAEARRIAAV